MKPDHGTGSTRSRARAGNEPPPKGRTWHRLLPWALLAVGLIDLLLLARHDLSPQVAAVAAGGAVGLKVAVGGDLLAAAGAYRHGRSRGRGRWAASNDALAWVLPRGLAWFVLVQLKVALDLLCVPWRPRRKAEHFSIHGDPLLRTLFWLNVALTGITLGIVELLLFLGHAPWPWHLLDLAGNAYQLWILGGLWATFATRPLRVDPHGLVLRAAVVGQIEIPYAEIAEARPLRQEVPSLWSWGRFVADPDTRTLTLAAGTPLNVLLKLRNPARFDPYQTGRATRPVDRVLLRVDEPRRFLQMLASVRKAVSPQEHRNPPRGQVPLCTDGPEIQRLAGSSMSSREPSIST